MEEWLKTGTMLSIYPTYLTSTKLALPFILKLLQSHPGGSRLLHSCFYGYASVTCTCDCMNLYTIIE